MLAERCASLICDAPEPFRCDVDEMLVVTFTEAAAAEMKGRITAALRRRKTGDASGRLDRQVELIDQAQVSTLHSFCARLLRQHFQLVGLDPAFSVMDENDAKLLRHETARDLLESRYDADESGDFQRFVDAYAEGQDDRVALEVIAAFQMISSLVDPQAWVNQARERLEEAAAKPLRESVLGNDWIDSISERLSDLRRQCDASLELVRTFGGFGAYDTEICNMARVAEHWLEVLQTEGIDVLASEFLGMELPKLKAISSSFPNKEVAKGAIDAPREAIKRGALRDVLRFTSDELREGVRRLLPHAKVLLSLIEAFGAKYAAEKSERRALDFSDLERFALRVLRDPVNPGAADAPRPSATARAYHRQFKHVLVDEYQDINEIQDAILSLVSHECLYRWADGAAPGSRPAVGAAFPPNLFCVGDVKQSIYRFRLAEPDRFLDREQRFRAAGPGGYGQVIDLQSNFRSRAPLLDAINGVFHALMTRQAAEIDYDQTHALKPGAKFASPQGPGTFSVRRSNCICSPRSSAATGRTPAMRRRRERRAATWRARGKRAKPPVRMTAATSWSGLSGRR